MTVAPPVRFVPVHDPTPEEVFSVGARRQFLIACRKHSCPLRTAVSPESTPGNVQPFQLYFRAKEPRSLLVYAESQVVWFSYVETNIPESDVIVDFKGLVALYEIPTAIELLRSELTPEATVRCLYLLGLLANDDPDAASAEFMRFTKHANEDVRLALLVALGHARNPLLLPVVAQLSSDPSEVIRRRAALYKDYIEKGASPRSED